MPAVGKMSESFTVMDSCPGCGKGVVGRVVVEVKADDRPALDGHISLSGKIVGLAVQHDCVPKVTREHDAALRGVCNDPACMDDTPHPRH